MSDDEFSFFDDDEDIIELVDVVEDDEELILLTVADDTSEAADDGTGESGKDPLTTATLADIYISQGFYKRALKIYRDLADANPANETYREKLFELKAMIDEDEASARGAADGAVDIIDDVSAAAVDAVSGRADDDIVRERVAVLEGWLDNIRRLRQCRFGNC